MSLEKQLAAVMAVSAMLAAYVAWPREADLRAFDPAEMARLETAITSTSPPGRSSGSHR